MPSSIVWVILSAAVFLFSKKIGSRYAFYIVERHYNYLYRILGAIHSFNSTARFSDVRICSHPILPTHFLSAYFRTQVTVKKTYQSSCIFRAASVLLKWEQLLKGTASSKKSFFFRIRSCLGQLLLSNNYLLVTNTFSDQVLVEDKYFFTTAIQNMYFFEADTSSE